MAGNATRSEANQSFFIYVKDNNTGIVKRVAIPGDVQIGLEGRPSELQLFGRLSVSSSTVVVNSTNKGIINVSNDDTVVAVSLSVTPVSGRIKAYLPPTPRAGQLHFIKDSSGTAGTVPIDVIPATGVMIDNQASLSLSDAYGSLALVWIAGQWRKLVAGLGASGGSGAPSSASYVTINAESGLSNERHLTGSTNLVMTDNGPNASVYFDLTPVLGGGAGTFSAPTVTVDAWGRITSIAAGTTGAPANASYVTVTNEPGLSAERRLTGSFGVKLVDGGANSNIVASFDPTLLIAGSGVTIVTSSGNITISSAGSTPTNRLSLAMLSAMVTTPQFSASKASLGVVYFDPTVINTSGSLRYYFRSIFGPVLGTGNAYVDLYDYNGIVTGVPAPVSGSVLTASLTQLTRRSVDLTSVFSSVTGSGILVARAWSDPSGSNYCNAGSTTFDLEW